MVSKKKYLCVLFFASVIVCITSCKKPAGPGGQATVKGKVYSYDYDNTVKYLISEGYSSGEKVYIIYGNNKEIGNTITTSIGGVFEFKYLTKGHYKVFANSLDTTFKIKGNDTEYPVVQEFDIKQANQTIVLNDIVINK